MKVWQITDLESDETRNHAPGLIEHTLCGIACDVTVDDDLTEIVEIEGKIDCPECIRTIKFCKAIKSKDILQEKQP